MPIEMACPECKKALRLRDNLQGRKARCPACKVPFRVPRFVAAPPKKKEARPPKQARPRPRPAQEKDERPPAPPAAAKAVVHDEGAERPAPPLAVALAPDKETKEERSTPLPPPAKARPKAKKAERSPTPPAKARAPKKAQQEHRPAPRPLKVPPAVKDEDVAPRPSRQAKKGSPAVLLAALLVGFFVLAGAAVGGYFVYRARGDKGGSANGDGADRTEPTRVELEAGPGLPTALQAPGPDASHVALLRGDLSGVGPPPRLERYDLRSGKRAHSMQLKGAAQGWDVIGTSPDAALVVFSHRPLWLEVTGVDVVRGTTVFGNWKPSYQKGDQFVGGRALAVLDRSRVLVVYYDDAVDVWTFPGAQRRPIRAASRPAPAEPFARGFTLSPDRKTLALWNGAGFDLIDPAAGTVRAKTDGYDLRPGEKGVLCPRAQFSPDGQQILAELLIDKGGTSQRALARWDAAADAKGARFDLKNFFLAQWWGDRHLYITSGGAGDFAPRGHVYDAATGGRLCAVTLDGVAAPAATPDGKLWTSVRAGGKTTLLGVPFPEAEVRALPAPGRGGALPTLEVNPDGVSPRTKR